MGTPLGPKGPMRAISSFWGQVSWHAKMLRAILPALGGYSPDQSLPHQNPKPAGPPGPGPWSNGPRPWGSVQSSQALLGPDATGPRPKTIGPEPWARALGPRPESGFVILWIDGVKTFLFKLRRIPINVPPPLV